MEIKFSRSEAEEIIKKHVIDMLALVYKPSKEIIVSERYGEFVASIMDPIEEEEKDETGIE